ncbi:hypothetical protein J18TS1_19020 [Oceanobacillus oncorhynchi subsp. incaldanensis]|nr:hypothetical protein J18TS1_19020 [Oceanobacillus oncorhynchi subsp. incaldanensis]
MYPFVMSPFKYSDTTIIGKRFLYVKELKWKIYVLQQREKYKTISSEACSLQEKRIYINDMYRLFHLDMKKLIQSIALN